MASFNFFVRSCQTTNPESSSLELCFSKLAVYFNLIKRGFFLFENQNRQPDAKKQFKKPKQTHSFKKIRIRSFRIGCTDL
jgi:hypothetical protein